jgi:hypothetical protein
MTSLNGEEKKTKPKGIDLRGEKSEHRIFRSFAQRAVTPSLTAEAVCSLKDFARSIAFGIEGTHEDPKHPPSYVTSPRQDEKVWYMY